MNARTRASGGLVATTLAATTAQEATTGWTAAGTTGGTALAATTAQEATTGGTAAGTTGGRTLAATIVAGTAGFRKE